MAEQISSTNKPNVTVVHIDGNVFLRDATGKSVPLKEGQLLNENEIFVTSADGRVQLLMPNGELLEIGGDRTVQIDAQMLGSTPVDVASAAIADLNASTDKIATALANGTDLSTELEATAAGLAGAAGAEDGHSFVQLGRIVEGVDPLSFVFGSNDLNEQDVIDQGATLIQTIQAADDAINLDEDGSVTVNVLGNDVGSGLTVVSATANNGKVLINPDGSLTYTPNANYNGPDNIFYTVSNPNGSTSSAVVKVSINPVNDLPVVPDTNGNPINTPVAIATKEDTPFTAKLNITDPDGDPLTFSAKDQPAHGTVTVNPDGSYVYTPATDYNGKDSFTVTVDDGKGGTTLVTVDVTVDPVNDAPVGTNQTVVTPEDTPINGQLVATDKDGDPLTFSAKDQPAHGTVTVNPDGSYVYTPATDYNGKDSFTVTVDDGKGGTTLVTVDVTVDPVNDAPVGTNQTVVTPEDTPINGQLVATDKDGDPLTFSAKDQPAHGTVTVNPDGSYVYTPATDYNGKDSFTVTVDDGKGGTTLVTVDVAVDPVNDAPVGTNQTVVTPEDTPINGQLVATDKDGDPLTFSAKDQPAHGTVTVNPDGSYVYTPATDYNGKDSFTVTVDDGKGGTTLVTVDVTVDPVNDAPVGTNQTVVTPEDTPINGQLVATDKDGDPLTFSAKDQPTHGTVTVNPDGSYVYTPATDYNGKDSFTVTVDDGKGGTTLVTIDVTVDPLNDPAVISGADRGEVTEDLSVNAAQQITTGGKLDIIDPDSGEAAFQAQAGTAGTYGQFSIDTAGNWTYVADNTRADIQALDDGETRTEHFTVLSADGTSVTVTVTLNGTNDLPVATAASLITKEGDPLATGQLVATDADTQDQGQLVFAANTPAPVAGLTINANGSYSFDPGHGAYEHLKAGEKLTLNVPYTVTDGTATVNSTLTIEITGTNDKPVVNPPAGPLDPALTYDPSTGTYSHKVPEDTVVTGKVVGSDVDGDTLSYVQATGPAHGTVSIDMNTGAYVYTPGKDYVGNDSFTVTVSDGQGGTALATVKIELTPDTDPAVISGADRGEVTEDLSVNAAQQITTGGKLDITDPDSGEAVFQAQAGTAGTYGQFSIDTAGNWTYVADNTRADIQALDDGETRTEHFTVLSADGTSVTVTVTLNGTNDLPVATAASLITKEGDPLATGQLVATDADTQDQGQLVFAANTPAPVAGLTINANGSYSFDPGHGAYEHLKAGEKLTLNVPYTVTDGTATVNSTLTIEITGTNDKPVVNPPAGPLDPALTYDPSTGTYSHKVPEDTVVTGKVVGSDVDGDTLSYVQATGPAHGTVSIDMNTGAYVYTPGKDYVGNDSFTVTVSDGQGGTALATVKIELTPDTDPAVISGADRGEVTEDLSVNAAQQITTGGKLDITDPDSGEAVFQAQAGTAGTYGQFSIDTAGNWTYVADNTRADIQALDDGETRTEHFTVRSADGTSVTVTVTLNGTNDLPVATAASLITKEGDPLATGQLVATDADTQDQGQLVFAANTPAPVAGLTINANGSYSFDPGHGAYEHLKAGEKLTLNVPYTVTDGTATVNSTLTIEITGTNDKPVVNPPAGPLDPALTYDPSTGTYSHKVPEDTVVTGKVVGSDVDGDTLSYVQATGPVHGTVSIDMNTGAYVYTPGKDYVGNDSFTVTVSDGQGGTALATVKIELTPDTDPAVISGADRGEVTEDLSVNAAQQITTGGKLDITDPDSGEAVFQAQAGTAGTYGQFSIDTAGNWTYVADNTRADIQALDDGETRTEHFTVLSADGTSVTVTVTLNGTNDLPVATAASLITKEGDPLATGQLVATDADTQDQGQLVFAANTPAPVAGLTINANGSYSFDPGHGAYEHLKAGEKLTLNVPYTVTDGTATVNSTLTIEITGTNDKPVVNPPAGPLDPALTYDPSTGTYSHKVPEDTVVTGKVVGSDVDGDTLSYVQATGPVHGTVSIDMNTGAYVYTPGKDYVGNDSFTVTVSDGQGGTALATVKIELTPDTDPAVISGADRGEVTEDLSVNAAQQITTGGKLDITDPDSGEAVFQAQAGTAGTYGQFSIDTAGNWTYVADNTRADIQALDDGETRTEHFTVLSADGTSVTVTVTLNGTNDLPVATAASLITKEGDPLATGQLVATDADTQDQGQLVFAANTPAPVAGLTINANGSYSFDPGHGAYEHLKAGEKLTLNVPYTVTDGTATVNSTLTIEITGTNDKPVVNPPAGPLDPALTYDPSTGTYSHKVPEDTVVTGKVVGSDVDGDTLSYVQATGPAHGTVSIDMNTGAYVYTPGKDYVGNDSFTVTVSDGQGGTALATVKIELTPDTDPAVISGADRGEVTEDLSVNAAQQITTGGKLDITDPDSGEAVFQAQAGTAGTYGQFSIDTAGNWTYVADNTRADIQALDDGETRTEHFTVRSADGTSVTVTVTLNGTNDLPVATAASLITKEGDPLATGQLVATDADTQDQGQLVFAANTPAPVAGLTINANGSYSFDPGHGAYEHLKAGEKLTLNVPYTVTDGTATVNSTLTIEITGTNDKPVVNPPAGPLDPALTYDPSTGTYSHKVPEDTVVTGKVVGSDVDGDTLSYVQATGPVHGTVSIDMNTGAYVYTPGKDYVGNDSFTVTVSDGQGGTALATVKIELTPVNDLPVLVADVKNTLENHPVSGNVLSNDSDPDGALHVTTFTVAGVTVNAGQTANIVGVGTFSIAANGDYIFTPVVNYHGVVPLVTYNVADPLGGTGSSTLTLSITPNQPPIVGNARATVSEEGLLGGITDGAGSPTDTTNSTVSSGTIAISDPDSPSLTTTLIAPTDVLSSGGQALVWSGSGTQNLVAKVGSTTIATVHIDNSGQYSVTLSGPIDHPVNSVEDVKSFNVGVQVSDGRLNSTGTLTVNVEDDAPVGQSKTVNVQIPNVDSNLILTIDVSGSMAEPSGISGKTRLQVTKEAITKLIDDYDALGDVKVMMVTFSSSATTQQSGGQIWMSAGEAKAILANLVANGGTNYDVAVGQVMTNYDKVGKIAGAQNIGYFFSDGEPSTPAVGLDAAETLTWTNFLNSKDINSLALGLGSGVAATHLNPVAYNGTSTGSEANAIIVTDLAQLPPILRDTIVVPNSGDLTGGVISGASSGFGADGGRMNDITVDGVKYTFNVATNSIVTTALASKFTFDAVTHQLKVNTALGGQFAIDMDDGKYAYTPPITKVSGSSENIGFTLIDNDGDLDTSNSRLTINIVPPAQGSTIQLAASTTAIADNTRGLHGEFFGYNYDADKSTGITYNLQSQDNIVGNLDNISDITAVINGRQGSKIVGTGVEASASASDATFVADHVKYGVAPAVTGNLGTNNAVVAGTAITSGNLYNFLGANNVVSDTAGLAATSTFGNTTDSIIRMVGGAYFAAGTYDIRVVADDGFRIAIDGKSVFEHDANQSPSSRVQTGVVISEGMHNLEVLYWEQGGNAVLNVEFKPSGAADSAYVTLGIEDMALFHGTQVPVLTELQDIIEDPNNNGHYLVRSGQEVTGSSQSDTITGSAGRDIIHGGAGNDVINAGAGADRIDGGAGSDTLTGGLGADTFHWTLADKGAVGVPAIDKVTDFSTVSYNAGGDRLDLRDLLQGENHNVGTGNLTQYLHFEKSGADTIIHVSSAGAYTGLFNAGADDQQVILSGIDLTSNGSLADTAIIQDLLNKGKLITD
ncbi:retention module-containing protein [Iodobacter ciconiae]|uniref:Retention module-containing protein n=1 Tax=Iodobacter ciconiae TaxID=2496266 RepID=A0A3S8ZV21_9NEIS|nr:retention module-containing protein [Iodobacter ciconiae]AZN37284.1 retention module-containing protein [Iodobacter ciconiae]